MRLDSEFIRLPLSYDGDRLRREVEPFAEADWRPHPQGHPGNSALPLVARGGDPTDDGVAGAMEPTPYLDRSPYLRQVLASFGAVIGRSRLMRLDGHAEATLHVDTNYYWADRVRVHVPIVTDPAIEFVCGERALHMAPGEAWVFDAWRRHNVVNPTGERRIHLVADTVGSSEFWAMVDRGWRPFSPGAGDGPSPTEVPWRPDENPGFETERYNLPIVMSPWEQERLARALIEDVAGGGDESSVAALTTALTKLRCDWRGAWARHGERSSGQRDYAALLERCEAELAPLTGSIRLENGTDAIEIARQMLLRPALNPELEDAPAAATRAPSAPRNRRELRARRESAGRLIARPVFVVAPPRSGTTLLFETLARSPDLWTTGEESHEVIESIPALHPAAHGWDSNRLTAHDARPQPTTTLREGFLARLHDRDGRPPAPEQEGLRLLEKTPKNSLRIPFLDAAFPEATFVYLFREPAESLSSMIEAWESGRFVTYPQLPGWQGPPWSMVLTPGWRGLAGQQLATIVAEQWAAATRILLGDLERLAPERWCAVGYEQLVADPAREIARICEFAGLAWDGALESPLPDSAMTLSRPAAGKWRARADELAPELERLDELAGEARDWIARPAQARARAQGRRPEPMSGAVTTSFGELLGGLESSLLATTYQAGKVIVIRRAGQAINTHFRAVPRPMGIAEWGGRLAIGGRSEVLEYRNLPEVAARLERAPVAHDACFVPHRTRATGDVAVHDLAWAGEELWIVATRFSCLATLDETHSFVPRWRPPFVTALSGDDRCHLNGLAVRDEQPAFVTALGATDEPNGWRPRRADGGVLVDVDTGDTVAAGLSMPHSPRWHRDRLWVLESGRGALAAVDLDAGRLESVVELPGFTRGLAFAGPIAFVGLSQVREGRSFGGLPLTARLEERQCGVYAVDLDSGSVLGFLRFEEGIEEIYDLELLRGVRFPELAEADSHAARLAYVVPEEALAE